MSSQTVQTKLFAATQGCPECGGTLDSSGRETHCKNCGLVTKEDQIDHGPEWRTYNREEQKRTGAPRTATRHDRGLSTNIGSVESSDISSRRRRRLARQAIKYLRKASELADKHGDDRVFAEHAREAQALVEREAVVEAMREMTTQAHSPLPHSLR